MPHGLPSFREKLVGKFIRDFHRRNQPPTCPFADFIVCPDYNIRPFAGLGGDRETVCNFLGRLNRDLETEVSLKFLNDRRQSSSSVIVHPDQKFTIGPCEQFWREKTESQQHQQQTIHGGPGPNVQVLELPDTAGVKKSSSQEFKKFSSRSNRLAGRRRVGGS